MLPSDLLCALSPFLDGREVLLCNVARIAPVPWEPWVKNITKLEITRDRYLWLRFAHHISSRELHDHLATDDCWEYVQLVPTHGLLLNDELITRWFTTRVNRNALFMHPEGPFYFIMMLARRGLVPFLRCGVFREDCLIYALRDLLFNNELSACECLCFTTKNEIRRAGLDKIIYYTHGLSPYAEKWAKSKGLRRPTR